MTEIKIYHVETQADYDALMSEFEEKGCEWFGGHEPTHFDGFEDYGKDTCVYEANDMLSYSSLEHFKNNCSDETLIEYKAKGENNDNLSR